MTKDLSLNDFMPSSLNKGEDAIFKSGKPLSDDKYRVDKDKVVEILKCIFAVSYTHLTLPTICSV